MGKEKNGDEYSNKYVSRLLRQIAAVYLLSNENRFKIIAYQNAAGAVENLNRELKDIAEEGPINGIPGLGPAISSNLEEYFRDGRSKHFNEVLDRFPSSLYKLMQVSSIGPKTAYRLVKEFSFNNEKTVLAEVIKAAKKHKIQILEGFGPKSEGEIVRAIELYESTSAHEERMPLPYAHRMAEEIKAYLLANPLVVRVDVLGSLRRMSPTIGDIDIAIVVSSGNSQKVVTYFTEYKKKRAVDNAGENKASIIIPPHIRVDLRVQDKASYGSMLQYFTGSKGHNIKVREHALRQDMSVSEWGIKTKGKLLKYADEPGFYAKLGLAYVEPELREGTDEVTLAAKNALPKLVELKDIKGDLHIHSSYDLKPSHDLGVNTYKEIVDAARSNNYDYVGFADHNPKQSGLTQGDMVEILKKRKYYIDKLFSINKYDQSHYFIGLETDILPDGSLAFPEKALDYVDYLIVSIHSSFAMPSTQMTKRILRALSHPKVKIFGHPTARLINKRTGINVDWPEVFKEVNKRNIALEINSWPERLDLPDTLVKQAKNYHVKFVIDTDAHAIEQMNNMAYGVSVARRGWCTQNDIMNTLSREDFKKWIVS